MTLSQLDELGGALKDLQYAVSWFEQASTPDVEGNTDEQRLQRAAASLEAAHLAWNRTIEAARPFLPAPSRPRGWENMSRVNGCR